MRNCTELSPQLSLAAPANVIPLSLAESPVVITSFSIDRALNDESLRGLKNCPEEEVGDHWKTADEEKTITKVAPNLFHSLIPQRSSFRRPAHFLFLLLDVFRPIRESRAINFVDSQFDSCSPYSRAHSLTHSLHVLICFDATIDICRLQANGTNDNDFSRTKNPRQLRAIDPKSFALASQALFSITEIYG